MVRCGRINLLDKVEVILVLWKGGRWMASEADVLSLCEEETEAKSVFYQHNPMYVSETIAWNHKVKIPLN